MSTQPEALRLAEQLEAIGLRGPVAAELRPLAAVESQRDALLGLLKEARKIVRASSSRNLVKDWDQRTTDAIKAVEGEKK